MNGLMKTVRYTARPHAKARNHKIPADAVNALTYQTGESLDRRRCLFEIMIVSHSDTPRMLPPVIATPSSGSEVFIGKRACETYPDAFGADEFLVVDITPL